MKRIYPIYIIALLFVFQTSVLFAQQKNTAAPQVTFIELGSQKCIPCKQMAPVIKSIENRYAGLVKVIFYDVWKPENKQYSEKYKINLIPTQVFLDQNGTEFYRHEGFLPEKDIDKLLAKRGIQPTSKK